MAIDGTYKCVQKTPMGDIEGEFIFKAEGDTLTGSVTSPFGTEEIQDGKIEGNELSWMIKTKGPMGKMKVKYTGTLDGDKIEGKAKAGIFPTSSFAANRV